MMFIFAMVGLLRGVDGVRTHAPQRGTYANGCILSCRFFVPVERVLRLPTSGLALLWHCRHRTTHEESAMLESFTVGDGAKYRCLSATTMPGATCSYHRMTAVSRARFDVMKPDPTVERDSLVWTPFVCACRVTRCGLPLSPDGRDRLGRDFSVLAFGFCLHAFGFLLSPIERELLSLTLEVKHGTCLTHFFRRTAS